MPTIGDAGSCQRYGSVAVRCRIISALVGLAKPNRPSSGGAGAARTRLSDGLVDQQPNVDAAAVSIRRLLFRYEALIVELVQRAWCSIRQPVVTYLDRSAQGCMLRY